MSEDVAETWDLVTGIITTYGLDVVGGIIILILGWMFAGWASRTVDSLLGKSAKVDETLRKFFASIVRYAVIVFTILAVLSQFGVETTSFIAVLGAMGLAVGLALQGTLGHVASGVMLLLFRPFKIGDFIDGGGVSGTVEAISLFTTTMNTPDNVHIIVPNGQLWDTAIKNFSKNPTRRVDMVMGIGYGDSIDAAMKAILEIADADERVHKDPAPMVAVGELADSSVNIIVRVWCNAGDYWGLKFDMTKAMKERFDAEGISIPFPQRDVHLINTNDAA